MSPFNSESRFYIESEVAVAKAAALVASSEFQLEHKQYSTAAVECYYAFFHTTLGLLWLEPDLKPEELRKALLQTRRDGKELPNKQISHRQLEKILSQNEHDLTFSKLSTAFQQALELREFATYGPRITYQEDQPLLGPCEFNTEKVCRLVLQAPGIFTEAYNALWRKSESHRYIGAAIVARAPKLLVEPQFPFVNWFEKKVIERAVLLVQGLRTSTTDGSELNSSDLPEC